MIDVYATSSTPRTRYTRLPVLLLVLVVTALSLTGCVRVRAAMAVSEDDRVTGEFVVAMPTTNDSDPGPRLQVPPEFKSRVRAEPYREEQFAGSRMLFTTLSFDELRQLVSSIGSAGNRYKFILRRSGELVVVEGMVDLTGMPKDRTDVKIKVRFPGKVTSTNGTDDDNTVSWTPRPGEVTELRATVEYSGSANSWTGWLALVFGLAVVAAAMVGTLALVAHRRTHRDTQDTTA
jgi:hypothetical protein